MSCEKIQKQLWLLAYGELSFEEEEDIHRHLETCPPCRTELERVTSLQSIVDQAETDPHDTLLADCRRNLRLTVSNIGAAEAAARGNRWFASLPASWSKWLLRPAGAFALVAVGFLGARLLPEAGGTQLNTFEPSASRVRYIEPNGGGRVQIVLEETRERVLSGRVEDAPIQRLLLAAARESSDPGVRVETVDLLRQHAQSADVRQALLQALRHDPNAGVRLKALDALRAFVRDPETRATIAEVLLRDSNPGIRTQAIDLLTQTREPSMVGVLQEVMTREENNYVRLKCQKVLRDLNASVETF